MEARKKLIIANWKCNPITRKEAKDLSRTIEQGVHGTKGAEIVLCPPFPWLSVVSCELSIVKMGAQDCHFEQSGAYTGAVSPAMLKDIGCRYVIIGHSERRHFFGETNEVVHKKVRAVLKAGLKAVLCIGEDTRDTFDEKGHWTHELDPKVKDQLVSALEGIKKPQVKNVIVTYEPVWAIGTGNPATPDDVLSAKIFVQRIISELYDRKIAESTLILYGGSTNHRNAASFVKEGGTDGLLVGGASLDAEEFIAMARDLASM